jgi:hypothetical protein
VNKPRRHRKNAEGREKPRGASGFGNNALAAFLICIGITIYLTLFLVSPLSSAAERIGLFGRWRLFNALLLVDDLWRQWFAGFCWQSVTQRMTILSLAAVIFGVAWTVGWILLRALKLDERLTRLETFVFAAAVGLNTASLATLALGLGGTLRFNVFATVAGVVLVTALWLVWRGWTSNHEPSLEPALLGFDEPSTESPLLRLDGRWLWLAAPFVLAIMLGAMLPPAEFDVREYHLQAPKEFYQAGRIAFLPHNIYANMPLGAEMFSLLGMIVAGDWWTGALVGKTLIAACAPMTALLLLAAGRRLATRSAGVIAAILYISIPWIALVSMQGLIEGVYAFYLFAALYATLVWQKEARSKPSLAWLGLAGFLAGAAVSCKYPALVFSVLPLAGWIAWQTLIARGQQKKSTRWLVAAQPTLVFSGAVVLGCGLWFAKNAVLTGNPTYPLLYGLFDGRTRTPALDQQWNAAHRPPNYQFADLTGRLADAAMRSDWQSPLMMPLVVLAFVNFRTRRFAVQLAAYWGLVFIAWWLFTHRLDRFWVPLLCVVSLLAGLGAVWSSHRWWRWTLATFLTVGLVYNLCVVAGGALSDNRYFADLEQLRVDPERINPWHLFLNGHATDVTAVLLVGDAQPFDLEVPAVYNTVFDDNIFEQLTRGRTPSQVRAALAARDISHVFVDWSEIDRYRSPGNYGISDFLEPHVFRQLVAAGALAELPKINDSTHGQLFRVLPSPDP